MVKREKTTDYADYTDFFFACQQLLKSTVGHCPHLKGRVLDSANSLLTEKPTKSTVGHCPLFKGDEAEGRVGV